MKALITGGSSGMGLEMKCSHCVDHLPRKLQREVEKAENTEKN